MGTVFAIGLGDQGFEFVRFMGVAEHKIGKFHDLIVIRSRSALEQDTFGHAIASIVWFCHHYSRFFRTGQWGQAWKKVVVSIGSRVRPSAQICNSQGMVPFYMKL